jgi:bacteriocin-type transport-associated protein
MTDTLLRELSNADLDWIITHGDRKKLPAGCDLVNPRTAQDALFLLIEGRLGLNLPKVGATDNEELVVLDELMHGEVVGIASLLDVPDVTIIRTLEPSLVLSLGIPQLQAKLREDIAFAAHFYRAIAIMLSNRLRRVFEHPDRIQFWGDRTTKDVLSVFGELRDSDVDWLVAFGQTQQFGGDRVLLQAGRPVDALYILLDGEVAISAPPFPFDSLHLCFAGLEASSRGQTAFATLSRGTMPGIISFLDFRPLPVTFRTVRESLVFALPRQTLATKLQVDDSFASRFYRVTAIQILALLQSLNMRLATGNDATISMDSAEMDEELDMDDLQQMSEGAKKFNWMLSQLGVSHRG